MAARLKEVPKRGAATRSNKKSKTHRGVRGEKENYDDLVISPPEDDGFGYDDLIPKYKLELATIHYYAERGGGRKLAEVLWKLFEMRDSPRLGDLLLLFYHRAERSTSLFELLRKPNDMNARILAGYKEFVEEHPCLDLGAAARLADFLRD